MPNIPPHTPTTRLLSGLKGIEIGGTLDNPFYLDARNVVPREFENSEGEGRSVVDIYAHGDDIPCLADNSVDYVFSSHVVEHLPDLIKALKEWNRVIKKDGYVVMIVPQRDARVLDRGRPLTTWDEIAEDHEKGMTVDTHPFDPEINYRGGHYHVFSIFSLMMIIQNIKEEYGLNWEMVGTENPDSRFANGFWIAYKVHK